MKNRALYFYDYEVGNFHYGRGHPMKPHRVRMTHDLLDAYGVLSQLTHIVPKPPTINQLTQFHADDFVDFIKNVNTDNHSDLSDQMCRFNVGEDCPVFDGLWEFCCVYSGGSIGGAQMLMTDGYDVAVNWAGGLHHGKKHEASGFCYINDCVLGALEFLRYKHRVLYLDIDIHHGDGVEEAFYTTPRVLCCSFHKYGDYFPGTGSLHDIGVGEGTGYSVNVPLKDGIDDVSFVRLFDQVVDVIMSNFQPEAVVLQCGADSLSGDRLGCFNLSLTGHGHAVNFFTQKGIPLLVLGGGGYTLRNVPKCWANETGIALGLQLDDKIPFTAEYAGYYGPDYTLTVRTSNMENKNDSPYLHGVVQQIHETFRRLVSPVGTSISSVDQPSPSMNTTIYQKDIPTSVDDHGDHEESEEHFFHVSRRRLG